MYVLQFCVSITLFHSCLPYNSVADTVFTFTGVITFKLKGTNAFFREVDSLLRQPLFLSFPVMCKCHCSVLCPSNFFRVLDSGVFIANTLLRSHRNRNLLNCLLAWAFGRREFLSKRIEEEYNANRQTQLTVDIFFN